MKVFVTGATGFLGAHCSKALIDAGHAVRLLVRDPGKIDRVLTPLGVVPHSHVVGDMTDADAVATGLVGCDAVLHCAALVSLDRRHADTVAANSTGAEVVLGQAVAAELDPIIHVSSASALFDPRASMITTDSPLTDRTSAYMQSKVLADRVARRHQDGGKPVTITYPGAILGPPAGEVGGEVADTIVQLVKAGVIATHAGAWSIVDARDLAKVHVALLAPGCAPRRVMCGGRFQTWSEAAVVLRDLTGRRFPVLPTPGAMMRGIGHLFDAVMRLLPVDLAMTGEAMELLTQWTPTDDQMVHDELGIDWRPAEETFRDVLLGAQHAGRLDERHLGTLATDTA
jgi:nucleoside-diphosphate-sugar epimerase